MVLGSRTFTVEFSGRISFVLGPHKSKNKQAVSEQDGSPFHP